MCWRGEAIFCHQGEPVETCIRRNGNANLFTTNAHVVTQHTYETLPGHYNGVSTTHWSYVRPQFHKADESPEGAPIGSPDRAPTNHHVSMDSVENSFPLTPQTANSGLPHLQHSGVRPPFSAMHPFYKKNFLNVFGRPPPRPVGNLVKPHPKSVLQEMLMNTSINAKNVFINIDRNIPPASPGMLFRPNTLGLPMPYPPISQAAIFTTPQSFVDQISKLITSPVLKMLYLLMKDLKEPDSGKIDHPPTASGGSTTEPKSPPEPQLLQSANETSKSDNEEMIQFGQMNTGVSQNQQQQVHEEFSPLLQIDEYFSSHVNRTGRITANTQC